MEKDLIISLENDIKQLEILIKFCKDNNFNNSIIFSLTSIVIKKKDILLKLL